MGWVIGIVGFFLVFIFFVFVLPGLMHEYGVALANLLLLLVLGGMLFAVSYFIARLCHVAQTPSIVIGAAVPAALGLGRLAWIALGLPTPRRDYNRWREQDHRDFWR